MRKCTRCGLLQPVSNFGRHKYSKNGIRARCKPCEVKANSEYRSTPKGRQTLKEYRSRDSVREAAKRSYDRWVRTDHGRRTKSLVESRYSDRRYARNAVAHALRLGSLVRQPCFICGAAAEAHHPDYSMPLVVTWLCPKHHKEAHRATAKILYEAGEKETLRF